MTETLRAVLVSPQRLEFQRESGEAVVALDLTKDTARAVVIDEPAVAPLTDIPLPDPVLYPEARKRAAELATGGEDWRGQADAVLGLDNGSGE